MSLEGKATGQTLVGKINGLDTLTISAYGIAVKNGFDGTEEEWLASLKGEKGDSGVFVGSGEMPEGYNVQVDPNGIPTNGGEENEGLLIYLDENGNLALPTLGDGVKIENGVLYGEQGEPGYTPQKGLDYFDGDKGEKGEKGDAFTYEDFTEEQLAGLKGEKGDTGGVVTVNGVAPDENGNVQVDTSSQSDWNAKEGEPGHVLNRTHYSYKDVDDIVYDYNNENRDKVDMSVLNMGVQYAYKISDYQLTQNDFETGTFFMSEENSEQYELTPEYYYGSDSESVLMYTLMNGKMGLLVMSVHVEGETDGVVVPSTGTYIADPYDLTQWDIVKVTLSPGERKYKQLDENYIPGVVLKKKELLKVWGFHSDTVNGFLTNVTLYGLPVKTYFKAPGTGGYVPCEFRQVNMGDGINNNYCYTFVSTTISNFSEADFTVQTDCMIIDPKNTVVKVSIGNKTRYGSDGITVDTVVPYTEYSGAEFESNNMGVIVYYG